MGPKTGRAKGQTNYKNNILKNIVRDIQPVSAIEWHTVAERYQQASGESNQRDYADVKRHWVHICCENFKKITGTSEKAQFTIECQNIMKDILAKEGAAGVGASSDSSNNEEKKGRRRKEKKVLKF